MKILEALEEWHKHEIGENWINPYHNIVLFIIKSLNVPVFVF